MYGSIEVSSKTLDTAGQLSDKSGYGEMVSSRRLAVHLVVKGQHNGR